MQGMAGEAVVYHRETRHNAATSHPPVFVRMARLKGKKCRCFFLEQVIEAPIGIFYESFREVDTCAKIEGGGRQMSKKNMSRREFMGTATAGVVSAGLGMTASCTSREGGTEVGETVADSPKIVDRVLGRTGLRIPVISFGVMNSHAPELLHKALDMGIKHMDTAHLYLQGNSERFIGQVLEESGKRDQVYLATKMRFNRDREKAVFLLEGVERQPAATEENLRSQLEESLRRLRTDYVDILYLHSCYSAEMATFEPLMKGLVKAKEAGKVRFIGISTHRDEPNVLRAAVDTGIYDVVLTAYNYLQKHRDEVRKAIAHAADKGVGVVAMKTQGGVQLNREDPAQVNHAAALKWVLQDENVCTTIPGITTFEQMDLDFGLMADLRLTPDEKRDLQVTALLSGLLYCQNCRTCIPGCPQRVEIPVLMRAFMYARAYGNQQQARSTAAELVSNRGLEACTGCRDCTASCPNGIDIGPRIRELGRLITV